MGRLTRSLGRHLGQALTVSLMVATLCFAALHALPGDLAVHAATARYGDERVTVGNVEAMRRNAGLDRPIAVQYAAWIGQLAVGEFGRSLLTGRPVLAELAPRLALTLTIGGLAIALALLLSIPLGVFVGLHPGGRLDRNVLVIAAMASSTPSFVAGTLLVTLLSVQLQWFPTSGAGSPAHDVLPMATLALALLPGLTRIVRHAVAGVAFAPYTVFAQMRGASRAAIAVRVAGRPALIPVVAYLPVLAMNLIEGFVTVELLFNLEGIGTLLVKALLGRDLPVVMGAGVAFVLLLGAANILTDILLAWLDPRAVTAAVLSHGPGEAHQMTSFVGIGLAAALIGGAAIGPLMLSVSPLAQDLGLTFEPPGLRWLLGTDDLGRSVLARVVAAAPLSLGVAVAASVATAMIGTAAGLIAATAGGLAGRMIMAMSDVFYAVPALLLVLLVCGLLGGGVAVVTGGLVLARWPAFARTSYPLARAALAGPDAQASQILGFGLLYRVRRHAWPAARPVVVSLATLGVGANVLAVSSLGFIGIGLMPPQPEWGTMVADALPYFRDSPVTLLAPAGALFLVTLAATLIGESLTKAGLATETGARP